MQTAHSLPQVGDRLRFTRSGRGARLEPLEGIVVYVGPSDGFKREDIIQGYKPYKRSFKPHRRSPDWPSPEVLVDVEGQLYRPLTINILPFSA